MSSVYTYHADKFCQHYGKPADLFIQLAPVSPTEVTNAIPQFARVTSPSAPKRQ